MKQILIISFSDLNHDARVSRQIDFIKDQNEVSVICYNGKDNDRYSLYRIPKTKFTLPVKFISSIYLLLRLHLRAWHVMYQTQQVIRDFSKKPFDIIIANDVESLPLAFTLKGNAKIIFDAHEYAPRHFEDRLVWRIFFQPFNVYLCKKFIPLVDKMLTVGKGLANEYKKNFGVSPVIMNNATWYSDIQPKPPTEVIRIIHHGGSTPSRKLELMIEMMKYLDDRFSLDLMLIVPQLASSKTSGYIDYLKKLAEGDSRIVFRPALKSNELIPFLNNYDIGIFLLPPINFNYANTLPNKLFDFIQARLAIAIGPTPEMKEIVESYDIGLVSDDFTPQSLASKLKNISKEDLIRFKQNASKAAIELSADKNSKLLNELVSTSIN
ncbi:MAG: glycosyltransferase family 4 protein [Cyclobacteriaceae bacterium]|nr:glycosyltransferase family 4 protein [Cyclobacteriaceae bacterium]